MTVSSAPIGTTGQSLDGFAVDTADGLQRFRESVVLTDPVESTAVLSLTSTQPISFYGVPVWVQGTPSFAVAGALPNVSTFPLGTTQVYGQVSSFAVNQANPVSSVVVSSVPHALVGTSQIFGQISTFPHSLTGTSQVFGQVSTFTGTVSTQVVSSLPFWVSQSSAPWDVRGGINVSSFAAVVSTWPLSTTMVNVVSTVAQQVNVTVTANEITSSIPFFVAQSSGPWLISPYATTLGGGNMTTIICAANLNTTVIKAGPGQIYSINVSYFGSSSAYLKLCNASTAMAASTAPIKMLIGLQSSTCVAHSFPVGSEYTEGILMYTVRTPFAAGRGTTGILVSSMTVSICYE